MSAEILPNERYAVVESRTAVGNAIKEAFEGLQDVVLTVVNSKHELSELRFELQNFDHDRKGMSSVVVGVTPDGIVVNLHLDQSEGGEVFVIM